MGINLDKTVRILTKVDGAESIYLRAIRLFEFQCCLFYPAALSATKEVAFQRYARLLAAIRLLDHLSNKETISWQDLTENHNYVEIFEKVIMRSGGWRAIENTWSAEEFDEQLKIRRGEARSAVKILDFPIVLPSLGQMTNKRQALQWRFLSFVTRLPTHTAKD